MTNEEATTLRKYMINKNIKEEGHISHWMCGKYHETCLVSHHPFCQHCSLSRQVVPQKMFVQYKLWRIEKFMPYQQTQSDLEFLKDRTIAFYKPT
jgi:hypothetical protein